MDLAASYDGASIAPLLDHLNSRLALRTFIVGHSSTLADLLCWSVLKRRDFASLASHPHLSRWFAFISSFPGNPSRPVLIFHDLFVPRSLCCSMRGCSGGARYYGISGDIQSRQDVILP